MTTPYAGALAGRRIVLVFCAATLCAMLPGVAHAAVAPSTEYPAVKTSVVPPRDATLTDPAWAAAVRATGFANATAREPARENTTALLLYDDNNLYVGFIAEQRGIPITQTQTSNDAGYGLDDEVTVSIDTSGNNSRVYYFTATPLGVRYEASSESTRYQPPWTTVASVESDGYYVMMTIPLGDMRVGNSKEQRWRINFSRYVAFTGDLLTWAYDAGSSSYCGSLNSRATIYCDSTRWPMLTGIALTNVPKAPPAYADVYALGGVGRDGKVFETTPGTFTGQAPRNGGFDATVPFTRSMAFVAAVGPDFSNVETDQTTIAPQEFPIQYSEYRPFFAQGSNYVTPLAGFNVFGPNNDMFYSPSLGIVDHGFKVEGTSGQSAIGLLDAKGDGFHDQAYGYQFATPDGALSLSLQGVSANHPDLTDRTIGIGGTYQNLHSGFSPTINYEQETGTLVTAPDLGRQLIFGETTSHGLWKTGLYYTDIGPKFSPVDGYTVIADVRGFSGFGILDSPAAEQSILKSYNLGFEADRFVDRSGAAHQVDANVQAAVVFKNLLSVGLTTDASELRTYAQAYPLYTEPRNAQFDFNTVSVGYRDGTPSPTDVSYTFGPFAVSCTNLPAFPLPCETAQNGVTPAYTQQYSVTSTRALKNGYSVTAQYAGTIERPLRGTSDAQFLRRLSLSHALGSDSQVALSLREISGTGGSAAPGESLALSFHKRFRDQSQLYFEYGSPASYSTLQRFVLKYVHHIGQGGAGT